MLYNLLFNGKAHVLKPSRRVLAKSPVLAPVTKNVTSGLPSVTFLDTYLKITNDFNRHRYCSSGNHKGLWKCSKTKESAPVGGASEVYLVERVYRLVFLVLFIVGFVGALASANKFGESELDESPVASLLRDVRLAQEVNDLNHHRWNQDVANINEDGLTKMENLIQTQDILENKEAN